VLKQCAQPVCTGTRAAAGGAVDIAVTITAASVACTSQL
jgi:hypothetical protein